MTFEVIDWLRACPEDRPRDPTQPAPDRTEDETMTDFTQLAQHYIEAWNETDATARREAVQRLWAPTGRYVDPVVDVQGHEQIAAAIGAVQEQFPGMVFELLGEVDSHHAQARFQWGLGPAGREPLVVGFDVVEVGQDGRVASVLGFLDRVPAQV